MERSKDYDPGTSANPEVSVGNLSADLAKLQILDAEKVLTEIQRIYENIIKNTIDPTSFYGILLTSSLMHAKSKEQANTYKKEAELFCNDGKYQEALLSITRSIANAEKDSAELASAYSYRSYILFELGSYDSCKQDVDRATEMKDCPPGLRKNLRERKKRCLMIQKNIKKDEEDVNLEWRKSCNLRPSNSNLPNTSRKLRLDFDEKRERHLIAIKDIQPGEILSVEDFYVTGLHFALLDTHCSFCLLECDTLIPCFTCTREMYCSENCRSQASNLFHQSECKFIRLHEHQMATPERLLAIRMFLIGTEQGTQLKNLTKRLKPRDIFSGKYDRNSRFDGYHSMFQFRRINQVDYHEGQVWAAVCIVIVLIRSSFFGDSVVLPDRLSFVQSYAALLLFHHLTTIRMVHPTVERLLLSEDPPEARNTESISAVKPQIIGCGIFLLQNSLIKRSCSANTSFFQQKRQRIAFATRKIRAGEKLSINFSICKFPDLMKQYRAEPNNPYALCENDECSTKCPKIELLEDEEIPFLSLDSSFKTEIKTLAMKACAEVRRARMEATVLSNKEILKLIIEHSDLLCENLAIPSFDIVLCEQLLVVFMRVLYCDHQKQNRHLSLEKYFDGLIESIAQRVCHLEGTESAPENQK